MMTESHDHNIQASTGRLGFKTFPATVAALSEYMVSVDPDLEDDIESFVEQATSKSNHILRVVVNDDGKSCGQLGLNTGNLSPDQIVALTNGILTDQQKKGERGFKSWVAVLTILLTAIVTWILKGRNWHRLSNQPNSTRMRLRRTPKTSVFFPNPSRN